MLNHPFILFLLQLLTFINCPLELTSKGSVIKIKVVNFGKYLCKGRKKMNKTNLKQLQQFTKNMMNEALSMHAIPQECKKYEQKWIGSGEKLACEGCF